MKKAHVSHRRSRRVDANHKHKRIKHTTADSRARPISFLVSHALVIPDHVALSRALLASSLSRPHSLSFSHTRSLSPSRYSLTHPLLLVLSYSIFGTFSLVSPFSVFATFATVTSQERRLTLRSRARYPPRPFFVVTSCP